MSVRLKDTDIRALAVYCAVAALMGPVWMLALMLSPMHREFLMGYVNKGGAWLALVIGAFVGASVIIAIVMRRIILGAGFWTGLIAGALIPFAASIICCLLLGWGGLAVQLITTGRAIEVQFAMFGLAIHGTIFSFFAAYVVIPMGWVSMLVMRWAGGMWMPRLPLSTGTKQHV